MPISSEQLQPWYDQNVPLDYKPEPVLKAPSSLDTWSAAFRTENSLTAAITRAHDPAAITRAHDPATSQVADPSFDALTDEYLGDKYKLWAKKFIRVQNKEEGDAIKAGLDRELEDRKTLDQAGFEGTMARMTAGLVDPISLIGMAITPELVAGKFAASAAKAIGVNAGFQAAQEAALQTTTTTRSWQESAINVAGAALVSGILGGAAGKLTKTEFEDLTARTARDLSGSALPSQRASMGAAAVQQTTREQETLTSAFGLEKIGVSPTIRLANSPSVEARRAAQELSMDALQREKNVEGIATPHAAELEINRYHADSGAIRQSVNDQFLTFKKSQVNPADLATELERAGAATAAEVLANPSKYLTVDYFKKLVAGAARNGDQSAIPQVGVTAKAYRSIVQKYEKELVDAGMLDATKLAQGPTTAISYVTRMWNKAAIKQDGENFRNILVNWLEKSQGVDPAESHLVADEIRAVLTKTDSMKNADIMKLMPKAGPLHERTLLIPDNLVAKFLENDIEKITDSYVRGLAPELVLTRTFGDKQLTSVAARLSNDYTKIANQTRQEFAAAGKSEAELNKALADLESQHAADLKNIQFIRDKLLGTAGKASDTEVWAGKRAKTLRQIVTMAQLGGQTVSSLADLMRPVMVHGLGRYSKAVAALASNKELRKASGEELRSFGVALEVLQSSRWNQIADIADDFGEMNKFERGVDYLSQRFGKLTGMQHWNSNLKQASGLMTGDRILAHAPNWANLKTGDRTFLAKLGIDDQSAARIAAEFKLHGEEMSGLKIANLDKWTDIGAKDAYELSVLKASEFIINTPTAGALPQFMSTWWGKTLMQFKSFLFATHEQTLLAGLQTRDLNTAIGAVGMVGLGAMVTGVKTMLSGKEPPKNEADWLINAVDNSGLLAIPLEINNISDKFTDGHVSIRGALRHGAGIETENKRFTDRTPVASLLGASVGFAERAVKVPGAVADIATGKEQADYQQLQKVFGVLPGQNLYSMRPYQMLFNHRETWDRINSAQDKMFGAE